jgi:hypothetical protein
LIVEDWMQLSEQLSDHVEARRGQQSESNRRHSSAAARILSDPDE